MHLFLAEVEEFAFRSILLRSELVVGTMGSPEPHSKAYKAKLASTKHAKRLKRKLILERHPLVVALLTEQRQNMRDKVLPQIAGLEARLFDKEKLLRKILYGHRGRHDVFR